MSDTAAESSRKSRSLWIVFVTCFISSIVGAVFLIRHRMITPDYESFRSIVSLENISFTYFSYSDPAASLDPQIQLSPAESAKLQSLLQQHIPQKPPFIVPFIGEAYSGDVRVGFLEIAFNRTSLVGLAVFDESFSLDTERDLSGNRIPCPGLATFLESCQAPETVEPRGSGSAGSTSW